MKLFEVGYVLKVVDQFSGAFKSFNNQMKGVSEAVEGPTAFARWRKTSGGWARDRRDERGHSVADQGRDQGADALDKAILTE